MANDEVMYKDAPFEQNDNGNDARLAQIAFEDAPLAHDAITDNVEEGAYSGCALQVAMSDQPEFGGQRRNRRGEHAFQPAITVAKITRQQRTADSGPRGRPPHVQAAILPIPGKVLLARAGFNRAGHRRTLASWSAT
jgi:hypothetical protein